LLLDIVKTDGKKYTLTLKDEILPKRADGREQSTVSWEYVIGASEPGPLVDKKIFIPWKALKPTYRGREKPDAEPLDLTNVKRVSLLMRSFFGEQEGAFEMCVRSIAAVKGEELGADMEDARDGRYRDNPDSRRSMDEIDEKMGAVASNRHGWFESMKLGWYEWVEWIFWGCSSDRL